MNNISQLPETITTPQAQRFYDRLGINHDRGERYERLAKEVGLDRLALAPGQWVLNAGVGTGKEQKLIQAAIAPAGVAWGIDISRVMLDLTRSRVAPPGSQALCQGDIQRLPFPAGTFDRIFCTYVLDLIPAGAIPTILREFHRVLRPPGRVVLVSLTEGTTLASRAVIGAWKSFYRLSPLSMGGCRPIRLTHALLKAGFSRVQRQVVVQLGMPSEVVVAEW